MPELNDFREELAAARRDRDTATDQLIAARAELAAIDADIQSATRRGEVRTVGGQLEALTSHARNLLTARENLSDRVDRLDERWRDLRAAASDLELNWETLLPPTELIEQLSDLSPIVLLPLRVEAKFFGSELRVRIYPDDVAIQSHEPALTADERAAGLAYWQQDWRAGDDREARMAAWRALVADRDPPRGAWIARALTPTNPEDRPVAPTAQGDRLPVEPIHPDTPAKEDDWTRPASVRVMPDRLVVSLHRGDSVIRRVGQPIPDPLQVGPDPLIIDEQLGHEADGNITMGPGLEWMADFDAAERIGLAVRFERLSDADLTDGFDRLTVLGVRFGSDPDDVAERLATLFNDHRFGAGLSFLPQGTPTNSTGTTPSGFDRHEVTDDGLFPVEAEDPLFDLATEEHDKTDGQRLAEALTVDPSVFQHVRHSDGRDLALAEAANTALFPGTLGYYLETMLDPALDLGAIRTARRFFVDHVKGRGILPTFRVGQQPYGVLLTTAFSRLSVADQEQASLGAIANLIETIEPVWGSQSVTRVGDGDDAEADILEVLGLHASSVAYNARHMVGPDYLQNLLAMGGAGSDYISRWGGLFAEYVGELLGALGYVVESPDDIPRILDMSYMRNHSFLNGPTIDSVPLSETKPLQGVAADGSNYIQWLLTAAIDDVRRQQLGVDDNGDPIAAPNALLYLLLRHSLLLEYWDTAMRLHTEYSGFPIATRHETELMNMEQTPNVTRWDYLELNVAEVSGTNPLRTVLESPFRPAVDLAEVAELADVKGALAELAEVPTAQLERLLAEHIDLCSYRLDAWKQGLVHQRFRSLQRLNGDAPVATHAGAPETGLILGSYGWLENVRPGPAPSAVDESDPAITAVGGIDALPGTGTPVEYTTNGGFVHAPSIGHATTAAVLRSGFLTHRTEENADALAVNLSSGRTRDANLLLEGMRAGWSLAALLGYRFERGLHDRSPALELDFFIHLIRDEYPLSAGKVHNVDPGTETTAAEARQHLDGFALIEAAADQGYPYGVTGLPAATSPEGRAIQAEVDQITDALDAVGDLGLAESVYQVVNGNYERASAVLDAVSRGAVPPEPEISRTPRGGIGQIHRVGVALDASTPATNPWPAVAMTPRADLEPRVNRWLGELIGDPAAIGAAVVVDPDGAPSPQTVTLDELDLQPLDLLAVVGDDLVSDTGVSPLERMVAARARGKAAAADSTPVLINWTDAAALPIGVDTLFALLPMLRSLRSLFGSSRPLNAADFVIPSDTRDTPDDQVRIDVVEANARLNTARAQLATTLADLAAASSDIATATAEPPVLPPPAAFDAARQALSAAFRLGLPDAYPHGATAADLSTAGALALQIGSAEELLAARLATTDDRLVVTADETPNARAGRLAEAAAAIFGRDVTFIPRFTLSDPTELLLAAGDSATLLTGAPPLAVEEWIEGVALVRPPMRALMEARLGATLRGVEPKRMTPVQLPHLEDDRWAALPVTPGKEPVGNTISWVLERPLNFGAGSQFVGLLVDEWTEVIPNESETTGVAFHFDQPNSEPPQAVLIAVSPQLTGNWTWDDLETVLTDTLEEARMRAVEPDHLEDSVLDQFLPAITPAVSHLPATIGLSLVVNAVAVAVEAVIEDL